MVKNPSLFRGDNNMDYRSSRSDNGPAGALQELMSTEGWYNMATVGLWGNTVMDRIQRRP